jgi:hypothetical protein
MQVVDGEDDRSDVEPRYIGRKATGSTKVAEEFTPWHVRQQHVYVKVILIRSVSDQDEQQSRV